MSYPSTFADIKQNVVDKLRLDATDDDQKVSDWVNSVYAQVCVETEANQTYSTTTLTAATATYTLPSAPARINQITLTPSGQTTPTWPLELVSLPTLLSRRAGNPTGSPTCYALVGRSQLEVSPVPDAADSLTFWYTALPTALSAATDVPILSEPYATQVLVYGAAAEGADFKMDPRRDEYRALYEAWLARYRTHLRRRQGGMAEQIPRYRARLPQHFPSQDIAW